MDLVSVQNDNTMTTNVHNIFSTTLFHTSLLVVPTVDCVLFT